MFKCARSYYLPVALLLFLLIAMSIETVFFLKLENTRDSHFSIGGLLKAEKGLGNVLFIVACLIGSSKYWSAHIILSISMYIRHLQSICRLCMNRLSTKK